MKWLRATCAEYHLEPRAVFRRGLRENWPITAGNEAELEIALDERGHFLPLPKEPAALANVVEVSVIDFLLARLEQLDGADARRGTERGYPDLEISGEAFGGGHHALDIKVARRRGARRTQSRITLYTGNTYFRYPELHWPGTFRPFADYESHLDLIVLYDFVEEKLSRIRDPELIVDESWKLASKERSSTTREYLGAVMSIDDLREGRGEFDSEEAFYEYWRKYPFKVGRAVEQKLRKLLAEQNSQ